MCIPMHIVRVLGEVVLLRFYKKSTDRCCTDEYLRGFDAP